MRVQLATLFVGMVAFDVTAAQAQQCRELRYAFQPDCFRPSLNAGCDKRKNGERLDLGPQIAVWISSADGTTFVDTLMVTSLTAVRGLGNRPGRADFRSSPKFPYGKRVMALPLWAHARGKLYSPLVMQDGSESGMGFHENVSSPDPYYCRPMTADEIDVDAITCPTVKFNSSKGRFDLAAPKTYYPPRNDLDKFISHDCDGVVPYMSSCDGAPNLEDCCKKLLGKAATASADKLATVNDLDAVSAATPAYGQPYFGRWQIPDTLPPGDYLLNVEISKEFDFNATHSYPSYEDPALRGSGMPKNLGQPSVVFQAPLRLDGSKITTGALTIAGYSDPLARNWDMKRPDNTIANTPGSGEGRLAAIANPWTQGAGAARVHATTVYCAGDADGGVDPLPIPNSDGGVPDCTVPAIDGMSVATLTDHEVTISFTQGRDANGGPLVDYVIKYNTGAVFNGASPGPQVLPSFPGQAVQFNLASLKGSTTYTVGVQGRGVCGESPFSTLTFTTPEKKFKQLEGCFIATAAYGSPLMTAVGSLRRVRDQAAASSALGQASVDVYYRSSPPVAEVLKSSDAGRAVVRSVLAPLVELASLLQAAPPTAPARR